MGKDGHIKLGCANVSCRYILKRTVGANHFGKRLDPSYPVHLCRVSDDPGFGSAEWKAGGSALPGHSPRKPEYLLYIRCVAESDSTFSWTCCSIVNDQDSLHPGVRVVYTENFLRSPFIGGKNGFFFHGTGASSCYL